MLYKNMLNLSHTCLKPPLITMDRGSITDVVNIIERAALSKPELTVLNGIIETSKKADDKYISAEMVSKEINKGEQSVRAALKKLADKNIFIESSCQTHKNIIRRASLFSFNAEVELNELVQGSLLNSNELNLFNLSYGITDEYGLADNLVCKYLFVVLLYNHKSRLSKNEGYIYVNNKPVNVIATTQSGKRLAQIKDVRYYMALLNICEQQMESRINAYQNNLIPEIDLKNTVFEVFEADILTTAGYGKGTGERKNMAAALNRLDGTQYDIVNPTINELYQLGIKERNIKIKHFDIIDYIKTKDGKIQYKFEFPQYIVEQMYGYIINDLEVFRRTDPRIFSENNSLRLAFLLWVSHKLPGKIIKESWQSLKDSIAPSKSMLNFKLEITKLLENLVTDTNDEEQIIYAASNKTVEQCYCSLNDINISLTLENGFYIKKKAINVISTQINKRRKLNFLNP